MRTKALWPTSIVIALLLTFILFGYSIEEGLPIGIVFIGIGLQVLSLVGILLIDFRHNKAGIICITIGNIIFVPVGLIPIVVARRVLDRDSKEQFLQSVESN